MSPTLSDGQRLGRYLGPMRSLRQRRLRLGPAPLAAGALLFVAAIWAMSWAIGPAEPRGVPSSLATKAAAPPTSVATPTSVAPPTTTTAPGSAVVVGIGDSVTSATVCGCTGFVTSYAARLPAAAGGPAHAVNLGINGLTAQGLHTLLTSPSPTASGVSRGDILLVTIGANDLTPLLARWQTSGCTAACYSPAVDAVGSDLSAVLVAAKALRRGRPTQVLVTDYWNVFADGDVARDSEGPAYLRWSDELTRAVNTRICTAAKSSGATCVDLYAPYKGNGSLNPTALLAEDGDHPNAPGNQLIASVLLAATSLPPR
jgi:lysophospholipase L1-like esterase